MPKTSNKMFICLFSRFIAARVPNLLEMSNFRSWEWKITYQSPNIGLMPWVSYSWIFNFRTHICAANLGLPNLWVIIKAT